MLLDLVRFSWTTIRALLPYPDLLRRVRVRHRAFRLVVIDRWPDDDSASGSDAAQLALLRALHFQRLTRRAVRWRHREEAALLARGAIDNVLVGLYCLYRAGAVQELTGGEHLAIRRITAYMTRDGDVFSREALHAAADTLGPRGHDLNLKAVAEWLTKEKGLLIAIQLYEGYYPALSHFFTHSSGFALMRHVRVDGRLRRSPAFPWSRRSAIRIADGCVGLLAAHIADNTDKDSTGFLQYAACHLGRILTPTYIATSRRWIGVIGWRKIAGTLRMIITFGRYVRGPGTEADPAEREAYIRKKFGELLNSVSAEVPEEAFGAVLDEVVNKILASMSAPADGPPDIESQEGEI